MGSTDYLRLNEHKIFKTVRETLGKSCKRTQNVLTVRDDVLYAWDFQDNCVLTLNVKAARSRDGDNVFHQTLLPTRPPLFTPEILIVNGSGTLLTVAGPCGVLVFELPERTPPYGTFGGNKEMVYCKSHSLDERLLAHGENVQVRQVKFHPGSPDDSHVLVLTADNKLRLYCIQKGNAYSAGTFPIGRQPMSKIPGSKVHFLSALGETGIDFDFAPPELNRSQEIVSTKPKSKELIWPVFVLFGNGDVMEVTITLGEKPNAVVKGPLLMVPRSDFNINDEACSILCLSSLPPVVCTAASNGTIFHSLILPAEDEKNRVLHVFESVELELGLMTTEITDDYCCPIFLHKDESKVGRYFATHNTGVHSVLIPVVDELQKFVNGPEGDDLNLFNQSSSADYLVCTKTSSSRVVNPVIGFSLYHEPTCIVVLLADGQLVSLSVSSVGLLTSEDFEPEEFEQLSSPLKRMLQEPFDLHIQNILKRTNTQPILKISGKEHTQQECYELLQKAAKIFREDQFKKYDKACEEIEKRIKALQMLRRYQINEINRMNQEKQFLQEKAEHLAEKYEDMKDKQEDLNKRCELLLIKISQRKTEPSDAEKAFLRELKNAEGKLGKYTKAVEKMRHKQAYQELQMDNWKKDQKNKDASFGSIQTSAIRSNLQDMTNQITGMVKEVNEFKIDLGLK